MSLSLLRILLPTYTSALQIRRLLSVIVADCAVTLIIFDEKVLRYNIVGRHNSKIHDTLNMLVTLYG
jgi:hypothetical protein